MMLNKTEKEALMRGGFNLADWKKEPPIISGTYLAVVRGNYVLIQLTVYRDDEAQIRKYHLWQMHGHGMYSEINQKEIEFWWPTPMPLLPKAP